MNIVEFFIVSAFILGKSMRNRLFHSSPWLRGGVILSFCAWLRRVFQIYQFGRPLGYDPGLYREMYHSYADLSHWFAFDQLPRRVFEMFPPLLGRISRFFSLLGVSVEWQVYFFPAVFSLVLACFVFRVVSFWGKRAAYLALILYFFSFVEYSIYRRHYVKQLVGMICLLGVVGSRQREKRLLSVFFYVAAFLTHRPVIALLFLLFVGVAVSAYRAREWQKLRSYLLSVCCGTAISLLLYRPFLEQQILPALSWFLGSFSEFSFDDGFQAGGTFLTISEFLTINRPVLFLGVVGCGVLLQQKRGWILVRMVGCLVTWIGLQLFFFQRMLGYLDIFLLCTAGVGADYLLSTAKRPVFAQACCFGLLAAHTALYVMWVPRVAPPIIEKEEFAFISHIDTFLNKDAVIVVPGIRYSPRIAGWSEAIVVAPGLFDTNVWGNVDEGRQENRFLASSEQKCQNIQNEFGKYGKELYVRVGSKQYRELLESDCFALLVQHETPYFALWQLRK